jgi:stage II sporulation protein E
MIFLGGINMNILKKQRNEEGKFLGDFQGMVIYHIKEMQQCLITAGRLFCDEEDEKDQKRCGKDVLESVILKQCVGCDEYKKCRFTIEDKDRLGKIIERQGGLSYLDLKQCHPCKNGQDFIEEANQIYERELFVHSMRNQMIKMRKLVGEQYIKAGHVLGDFFEEKMSLTRKNEQLYHKIKKEFEKHHLKIWDLCFYQNPQKGRQVYLYLKKKRGGEISTRQAAALLSQILKEKMIPLADQKKLIKTDYEMYGFTPEEKFYVISGIRTAPFLKDQKNGDCFSMAKIAEGRYTAMISDGMGTGNAANEESKKMIEMMEEMLGTGIEEDVCIRLLDSIISFQPEKEKYATLDLFLLDLFAGIGTFFKIGACPCLLKRKGNVEILETNTASVGMSALGQKVPFYRKKMESEDLLVMFSDGVLDCIPDSKIETLAELFEEMDVVRPQAVADQLFDKITNMQGYEKRDDVTILVLGIWDRY